MGATYIYYMTNNRAGQVPLSGRSNIMKKNTNSASGPDGHITPYIPKATKQEIHAALKLVELLHLQGEIPQHVYRNISNEYYGKGVDITENACYTVNTSRLAAV